MAKQSKSSLNIATILTYLLLLASLGTYFIPVVSVHLPALGTKSWSVRDIVKTIPKGTLGAKKETKKSEFTLRYDFSDFVTEVTPRTKEGKTSKMAPELVIGALIPISLALAYLLVLLNFFLAPLARKSALSVGSLLTVVCSGYTVFGVYYLNLAAQRAFASSLAKVEQSPFAIITKNLVQQAQIQPDIGLYALAVLAFLVFLISLYQAKSAR